MELGGAETNLRNLMGAFDHSKFEHHVAYSFGGEVEPFFREHPQVHLYRYSKGLHRMTSFSSALIMARLWFYIVSRGIRIVHTHNFNAHFWSVYPARLAGAKVVEHVHDFRYFGAAELERRKGVANLLSHIGKFKGLSDRVVVLTEQNRKWLLEHRFYPENKIRIIRNGIPILSKPVSSKKAVAAELGIDEDSPVILIVSRLAPTKNIELVLRIAPAMLKEAPRAKFVIAGSGELLEELKKKNAEKGLGESIRFIGYQADPSRLLAACDVYWSPSYLELHSISILEALIAGAPVVAGAGVGCNDEVLSHGKDSFLLDPFSDRGWAETLLTLLRDKALRDRVGEEGRRLCHRLFDIRRTAAAFEDLYRELLGR
jgi:glycosyltransferase involved in cell wall biosynthesis